MAKLSLWHFAYMYNIIFMYILRNKNEKYEEKCKRDGNINNMNK